jgi:hypothetical protein
VVEGALRDDPTRSAAQSAINASRRFKRVSSFLALTIHHVNARRREGVSRSKNAHARLFFLKVPR